MRADRLPVDYADGRRGPLGGREYPGLQAESEKAGLKPEFAEITMKPTAENPLKGEEGARMQKLLDALENIDAGADCSGSCAMSWSVC